MSERCKNCGQITGEYLDLCPSCFGLKCNEMLTIKDSGHRREFETGAVRDMQEGKGRYDLLPWEAIHELAIHCEQGAEKYGERNVDKGIPIHSFIDSAFRHIARYMMGHRDEPHLRAALWNIAWAIWTEIKRPDLQDIPARREE